MLIPCENSLCQCPVRLPDTLPPPRCDCQEDISTRRHCVICHLPFDIENRLHPNVTDYCSCFLGESNVLCWYPPVPVCWVPVYYICVPAWGRLPDGSETSSLSSLSSASNHSLVSPVDRFVDECDYSSPMVEASEEYSNSFLKNEVDVEYNHFIKRDEVSSLAIEEGTQITYSGTSYDVGAECTNLSMINEASDECNHNAVHEDVHFISKEIVDENRQPLSIDEVEVECKNFSKDCNQSNHSLEVPCEIDNVEEPNCHLHLNDKMTEKKKTFVSKEEEKLSELARTNSSNIVPPSENVPTSISTSQYQDNINLGGDVLHYASIMSESLNTEDKNVRTGSKNSAITSEKKTVNDQRHSPGNTITEGVKRKVAPFSDITDSSLNIPSSNSNNISNGLQTRFSKPSHGRASRENLKLNLSSSVPNDSEKNINFAPSTCRGLNVSPSSASMNPIIVKQSSTKSKEIDKINDNEVFSNQAFSGSLQLRSSTQNLNFEHPRVEARRSVPISQNGANSSFQSAMPNSTNHSYVNTQNGSEISGSRVKEMKLVDAIEIIKVNNRDLQAKTKRLLAERLQNLRKG